VKTKPIPVHISIEYRNRRLIGNLPVREHRAERPWSRNRRSQGELLRQGPRPTCSLPPSCSRWRSNHRQSCSAASRDVHYAYAYATSPRDAIRQSLRGRRPQLTCENHRAGSIWLLCRTALTQGDMDARSSFTSGNPPRQSPAVSTSTCTELDEFFCAYSRQTISASLSV
jgi:hypothetical protein